MSINNLLARYEDFSSKELQVLLKLFSGVPQKMSELRKNFNIPPATMTRMVRKLEKRGWIERRSDAKHRQRVVLWLTEAGKREADAAWEVELQLRKESA